MKAVTLRWLMLALLPAFAVALFVVDSEIQARAWSLGNASDFREIAQLGTLVGALFGPAITAMAFAYPIARVYGRNSLAASALMVVPTVAYTIYYDIAPDHNPFFICVYIVQIVSLGILVPMTASLASRALANSSLVILNDSPRIDDGHAATPRLLKLLLIPILGIALFVILKNFVQPALADLAFMLHTRGLRHAALVLGSVLGPAATALAFSYPIARVYSRYAVLVAILIVVPSILASIDDLTRATQFPWLIATDIAQVGAMSILIPLAAWLAYRKLGRTRLAVLSRVTSVA